MSEMAMGNAGAGEGATSETLRHMLSAIRSHLGMDVAFIAEFSRGMRVFRYIDSKGERAPIRVGGGDPLDESYCQRVVDGRLPELIHDAALLPAALELPVTLALPVGAHLSVPIRLDDGRLYGTLCCFSYEPDPTLRERELSLMRLFSEFAGKEISRNLVPIRSREEMQERIRSILDAAAVDVVYQPIYHLRQEKTVGFESLARFPAQQYRSPDVCFGEAAQVGLGEELEMLALKKALAGLDAFPEDVYITLNTSPEHILSGAVARVLDGVPGERVVIEITEHAFVADYAAFGAALAPLRERGISLAVDDAGAGYASFHHILELEPDLIKLDMRLTRNIHADTRRRALAAGLIAFALATGSRIVAEGVESAEELEALRGLGVSKVQGYFVGRPAPVAETGRFLRDFRI